MLLQMQRRGAAAAAAQEGADIPPELVQDEKAKVTTESSRAEKT